MPTHESRTIALNASIAESLGDDEQHPRLIVLEGRRPGARLSIDRDGLVVGRDPLADLHLDSETVSKQHARLTLQDGVVSIIDTNSRNGLVLNERKCPVGESVTLAHGDVVRAADHVLLFLDRTGFMTQEGVSSIDVDSEKVRAEVDALLERLPPIRRGA